MKAYLLTVIAASLAVSVVGILSPSGEKGGISKHVGLLSSLILVCLVIAPLKSALDALRGWSEGDIPIYGELTEEDYSDLVNTQNDASSKKYFTQMLTERLQAQFSLKEGTVRCAVQWQARDGEAHPTHVTVLLSGSAILQNPHEIESYVTSLLTCTCDVALE